MPIDCVHAMQWIGTKVHLRATVVLALLLAPLGTGYSALQDWTTAQGHLRALQCAATKHDHFLAQARTPSGDLDLSRVGCSGQRSVVKMDEIQQVRAGIPNRPSAAQSIRWKTAISNGFAAFLGTLGASYSLIPAWLIVMRLILLFRRILGL